MRVLIHLRGGLGNQLFEIANGIAYCERYGYELAIQDKTDCKRDVFWESFLEHAASFKTTDRESSIRDERKKYREPFYHYAPIPEGKSFLYGYFQSRKYFKDFEKSVRKLLTPPKRIQDEVQEKYGKDLLDIREDTKTVVIHIRRTDYVESGPEKFHSVTTENYYKNAIELMDLIVPAEKKRFIVFSDDIEWCKKQPFLLEKDCEFIDEPNDCYAIWLMSRFENFIIPNSSFAWWATWFSESDKKRVVAPSKWFGSKGPQDFQDIYEPDWIRLDP